MGDNLYQNEGVSTDVAGFNDFDLETAAVLMRGGDTLERAIARVRHLKEFE